jgi:hypothetical protein
MSTCFDGVQAADALHAYEFRLLPRLSSDLARFGCGGADLRVDPAPTIVADEAAASTCRSHAYMLLACLL